MQMAFNPYLADTGGKKGGKKGGGKKAKGTKAPAKTGVASKAIKAVTGFGKGVVAVGTAVAETLPIGSSIVAGVREAKTQIFGSPEEAATAAAMSGQPVQAVRAVQMSDGSVGYRPVTRKKKSRRGLSGSDLKGYMRTVRLAKMLVRTPKYMRAKPRRSTRRAYA